MPSSISSAKSLGTTTATNNENSNNSIRARRRNAMISSRSKSENNIIALSRQYKLAMMNESKRDVTSPKTEKRRRRKLSIEFACRRADLQSSSCSSSSRSITTATTTATDTTCCEPSTEEECVLPVPLPNRCRDAEVVSSLPELAGFMNDILAGAMDRGVYTKKSNSGRSHRSEP